MRSFVRIGLAASLLSLSAWACGGETAEGIDRTESEAGAAGKTGAAAGAGATAGAAGRAGSAAAGGTNAAGKGGSTSGGSGGSVAAGTGGVAGTGSTGLAGTGGTGTGASGTGGTAAAGTGGTGSAGTGGSGSGSAGTGGTGAAGTGGTGSAGAPPAPIDGPKLKICSFNIRVGTAADGKNAWDNRKDQVFKLLQDSDADFIGMQEDLTFQLQQLDSKIPGYDRYGVGAKDGAGGGERVTLWYLKARFEMLKKDTFWLSDTPEKPGSITWGNDDLPRVVTWGRFREKSSGYTFYVYNTHFDHRQNASLAKGARLLSQRFAERAHPDEPVILTGDFNMHDGEAPIRYLEGKAQLNDKDNPVPLLDTFRALHPDEKNARTAHGFEGGVVGTPIDFIFLSKKDGEVKQAWINHDNQNGLYPSDHYPIFATLKLVDKK